MPNYSTLRAINGAESLIAGIIILVIGITLLHRGYAEREQWVRQVPGRIVLGAFLSCTALLMIEAAVAKLLLRNGGPGSVGQYINNWYVNSFQLITLLLGVWSIYRLFRNTLGSSDIIRPEARAADALERLATATERIEERTT